MGNSHLRGEKGGGGRNSGRALPEGAGVGRAQSYTGPRAGGAARGPPPTPAPNAGGRGGGSRAPRTELGGGRGGEGGGAGRPNPGAGRRDSPLLPACGARAARIPRSSDAEIRTRSNPSAIFAAAATAAATPPPPRAARKPRRTGGARAYPPPTRVPAPSRLPPLTTVAALGGKALKASSAAPESWGGGHCACAKVWSGK